MSLQNRRLYEFGSFRLEPAERRLLREGEEVPLPPKAFDLLVVLVSRSGHLVSKEDLLKEVWPGTFVEEASLSYTVSVLRKALHTEADQVRYIDTVQRLGYRFTTDVRTVMADAFEGETGTASPESPPPEQKPPTGSVPVVERLRYWVGGKLIWKAAVAAALLVLGVVAVVLVRQAREARQPLTARFVETVPGHIILTDWDHPVISPDGHRVAFTGLSEGRRQLWVRPLESSVPILLPGTDGATRPFWSPDSKSVAFFADRKLKRIDVEGGEALTLCCDSFPFGHTQGAWGSSGVILFSNGPVYSVVDTGGAPRPVTQLDASRREAWHTVVGFLSDSRRFVFYSDPPPLTHYVTSLDDPNQRRTLTIGTGGRIDGLSIVRDHLLYTREGVVVAQPFNEQTLETRSALLTLAKTEPAPWQPRPSASRTGVVVFRSSWYTMRQLAWRRRDGDSTAIGSPDVYTAVELSPSGTRAVVVKGGSGWVQDRDLWLVDLTNGIPSRLTTHPALESSPAWSPDGRRIAYHSSQAGVISPFVKDLDTGKEERLLEPTSGVALDDWTADGRFLVLRTYGSAAFVLPLTGVRKLERLVDTPYGEDQLQVSPDGRWIAFNSEETKTWEVHVARFPGFTDKRRVSVAGGVQPRWRGDGRELFYLAPDGTMMVVQSPLESTGEFARAQPLFRTSLSPASHQISEFDVTSDGQSFLLLEPTSTRPQTFTFLLNWIDTVEK